MSAGAAGRLQAAWRRRSDPLALLLFPLSLLFCLLATVRRHAYRLGLLRVERLPLPVVVVGNVTVGGSGKTPLVAALVERLRAAGYRPGIVSRGYGGQGGRAARLVAAADDPRTVGDEPLLLARRCAVPVAVCRDRVAAARLLLSAGCDLVVADDGLQHYRLGRDVEIAVVDGERRLGNGWCLPAGPLREPAGRLRQVDLVVANGPPGAGEWAMELAAGEPQAVDGSGRRWPHAGLAGRRLHAVAGIGHPGRFFATLRRLGAEPLEHPFPDHHPFTAADLAFAAPPTVMMTEKDAVKCREFAAADHWYLPVTAQLDDALFARLLASLQRKRDG